MTRNRFLLFVGSIMLGMGLLQCTQAYGQPDGDHSHGQYLTVAEINEAHALFMSKLAAQQADLDAMQAQLDAHLEGHPQEPTDPTDPVDPVDPIPPDPVDPPDPPTAADCTKNVSPGFSIQSAINASGPGDVICVADGTYEGRVSFTKPGTEGHPIVLQGESMTGVIIKGNRKEGILLDDPQDNVGLRKIGWITLRNLTVSNSSMGIACFSTHDIVIENVVVKNAWSYGLFLAGDGGSVRYKIRNSFFHHNGRSGTGAGVRAGDRSRHFVEDIEFINCVFHSNAAFEGANAETGTGININSPEWRKDGTRIFPPDRISKNIILRRCMAYNNGSSGITSQLPADLLWEDCISFGNNVLHRADGSIFHTPDGEGYGFRLGFSGAGCRIVRCVAFGNRAAGILLASQADAVVSGCISYNNPHGVYIKGGNAAMTDTTAYSNTRNFRMDGVVSESGNSTVPMALPTTIVLPSGDLTTWAEVAAQLPGVFD